MLKLTKEKIILIDRTRYPPPNLIKQKAVIIVEYPSMITARDIRNKLPMAVKTSFS